MNTAKMISEAIAAKSVDQLRNLLNCENFNIDTVIGDDGFTSLHLAIKHGNEDQVKLLLEKGANLHLKTQNGDGCLHLAVDFDALEVMKLFLGKVNVNEVNNSRQTPLHIAVLKAVSASTSLGRADQSGSSDLIDLLLSNGADPNSPDNEANTPFHFSFGMRNITMVECFLRHGANVREKDREGRNALHLAALYTQLDAIHLFVESMKMNVREMANGRKTVLHLLLDNDKYDYKVPSCNNKMFYNRWNNEEETTCIAIARCIVLLIQRGADVDALDDLNMTPLDYVLVRQKNKPIVAIVVCQLLACGATIECDGRRSSVFEAIERDDLKWICQLISEIDEKARIKLPIRAINLPNSELRCAILGYLVKRKVVSVDERDEDGSTLLHLSIEKQDLNLFRLLIENGADLQLKNSKMMSSLYLTVKYAFVEATRILVIDKNVRIQPCDQNDVLSIMENAVWSRNKDMMRLLLENGGNPNDPKAWRATCWSIQPNLLEILESYGEAFEPNSERGLHALRSSIRLMRCNMLEYLLNRGCCINLEFNGRLPFEENLLANTNWDRFVDTVYKGNCAAMFEARKDKHVDMIIVEQIALLSTQGLEVHEKYWTLIKRSKALSYFYENCVAVLQLAKVTPVCEGYNIVYLHFLTRSVYYLSERLRSENIRAAFVSADKSILKGYENRIRMSYERALARLEKVIRFEKSLREIFGDVLPDRVVIRMLSEYYNDRDYRAVVDEKV